MLLLFFFRRRGGEIWSLLFLWVDGKYPQMSISVQIYTECPPPPWGKRLDSKDQVWLRSFFVSVWLQIFFGDSFGDSIDGASYRCGISILSSAKPRASELHVDNLHRKMDLIKLYESPTKQVSCRLLIFSPILRHMSPLSRLVINWNLSHNSHWSCKFPINFSNSSKTHNRLCPLKRHFDVFQRSPPPTPSLLEQRHAEVYVTIKVTT